MKSHHSHCFAISTSALILFSVQDSRAAVINSITWFSGIASVAGESVPVATSPNNDDVVGDSPNDIFVLQKDYTGIGVVDLVFTTTDSGGTTEYKVTEGVFNNTGMDWTGYHIELGFGTGVGFVPSTTGDGLDFDSPDFNSTIDFNPAPGFFPTVLALEDDLIASGGIMPNFTYAGNFIFHVDVPDGISQFTIRQSPIPIPEPGATVMLLLGAALTVRRRR